MLAIDMFCGLGGWTEALLAEGWQVVGFDIERHVYGDSRYPAQLVLQDVTTLHGSQFRNADLIVASPPCQEFSYMAMPWSRGKQIAAALREAVIKSHVSLLQPASNKITDFPEGYTGSRTLEELTALFDACFRIQREASEAAGRYIPMVVENVKGAQPWVGRAKANYGSFYLWGDVESIGGRIVRAGAVEFGAATVWAAARTHKVGRNFHQFEHTGIPSASFHGEAAQRYREGTKQHGSGPEWFDNGITKHSSRSNSRKAASAEIAKIPYPLAQHIAKVFKPSK